MSIWWQTPGPPHLRTHFNWMRPELVVQLHWMILVSPFQLKYPILFQLQHIEKMEILALMRIEWRFNQAA